MIIVPWMIVIYLFQQNLYLEQELKEHIHEDTTPQSVDVEISTISSNQEEITLSTPLPTEELLTDTPINRLATLATTSASESEPEVVLTGYQALYPDLYCDPLEEEPVAVDHAVYLTFDDGPSAVTADVLDTLAEKGVKATFFVVGTNLDSAANQALAQRIVDEGHVLAVHTETHVMDEVYASVEAFLEDFYKVWYRIKEITGVEAEVFRFPGGSVNSYNSEVYDEIVAEMTRRGFVYFDWNASSDDSVSSYIASAQSILESSTDTRGLSRIILLMHDSYYKGTTADALPDIIDTYIEMGFTPEVLTRSVKPIIF